MPPRPLPWADLHGLAPPPNGRLAQQLVCACENLADHLTHFYLFFMPDFARPEYAGEPWFPACEARFRALTGSAAADVLPARAEFMHLMGLMAGKWPHTLSLQPGGTARPLEAAEILRLITLLHGFRRFLERHTFGDDLESVAGLDSVAALADWRQGRQGDLALFLGAAEDLDLGGMGRATDRFLSYGAQGLAPAGVWDGGVRPLDPGAHRRGPEPRLAGGGCLCPRPAVAPSHGPTRPGPIPGARPPGTRAWSWRPGPWPARWWPVTP